MNRTTVFAVVILALCGCGPGGNQRSATIPQADTPPDPPAELASASSSALPSDPRAAPADSGAPAKAN
jgi:hypothetical protein